MCTRRKTNEKSEAFFSFIQNGLREHHIELYGKIKIFAFSSTDYKVGLHFSHVFGGNNLNAALFHWFFNWIHGIYWNWQTYRFFSQNFHWSLLFKRLNVFESRLLVNMLSKRSKKRLLCCQSEAGLQKFSCTRGKELKINWLQSSFNQIIGVLM